MKSSQFNGIRLDVYLVVLLVENHIYTVLVIYFSGRYILYGLTAKPAKHTSSLLKYLEIGR